MATKARKLKVYQAQFGFHDSVVAAPNQTAALKAWGVRQNLFAEGQAVLCEDPKATEAALLHPETPLRRTVGSAAAFALEPTTLPQAPKPKKTAKERIKKPALEEPPPRAPPKPAPDRRALTAAEEAVSALVEKRRREEAVFRRREEALVAQAARAQSDYVAARRQLETALAEVRQDFVDAGGDPADNL